MVMCYLSSHLLADTKIKYGIAYVAVTLHLKGHLEMLLCDYLARYRHGSFHNKSQIASVSSRLWLFTFQSSGISCRYVLIDGIKANF